VPEIMSSKAFLVSANVIDVEKRRKPSKHYVSGLELFLFSASLDNKRLFK